MTRRLHVPGARRALLRLHPPERRTWGIEAVVPLAGGGRLHANTQNYIEWHVYFFGAYEREVARLIRRHVRAGRSAIDVGANVGVHTLVMARAVGSGAVLACEPNPNAAARLRANLELNALRNVTVAEVAVSDSSGQAPLFVPTAFEALASLQGERLGPAGVGTVSVPTATLDQLVAETGIRDVDVLKIDAEGVEGAVLQGSETTIARDQPVIFFECLRSRWEVAGHELEATLEWLRTLGYVTFMCVGYGGLHSLEHLETWGRDVVAFPQRRAD